MSDGEASEDDERYFDADAGNDASPHEPARLSGAQHARSAAPAAESTDGRHRESGSGRIDRANGQEADLVTRSSSSSSGGGAGGGGGRGGGGGDNGNHCDARADRRPDSTRNAYATGPVPLTKACHSDTDLPAAALEPPSIKTSDAYVHITEGMNSLELMSNSPATRMHSADEPSSEEPPDAARRDPRLDMKQLLSDEEILKARASRSPAMPMCPCACLTRAPSRSCCAISIPESCFH